MAMHCVPIPLAFTGVEARRQFLRVLLKYNTQDRAPRPAEFKHVAPDHLALVRKHRKSRVGPIMVYVAPGREVEYQDILLLHEGVWLTMPPTYLSSTIILLDPPPLFWRLEIVRSAVLNNSTRLLYECKTPNVSSLTGNKLAASDRLQSLLPPSPGETTAFANLSRILPAHHPLWPSYTRGNPSRWTWDSFSTIAINLCGPHPWANVFELIMTSTRPPADLYQYWLEYGYDALMDYILGDSHVSHDDRSLPEPQFDHTQQERESWTSSVTNGIYLAMPALQSALRPELEALVSQVSRALQNPTRLSCKAADLHEHVAGHPLGRFIEPCVLITEDDVIVAWYLPTVLSLTLLDMLDRATSHVEALCAQQIDASSKNSWRSASEHHICPEGAFRQPGTANFSPGYYDQAGQLVVSAALQDRRSKQWMADMLEVQSVLDAVVLLTHPSQFIAGVSVVADILADSTLDVRAPDRRDWPSRVWQGMSIMINRITPAHIDSHGADSGFDLLLGAGPATHAELTIPELGGSFVYLPGTIVMILGKRIKHEVKGWSTGDRICYAQWLRKRSVDANELVQLDWCNPDTVRANWAKLAGA